MKKEFFVNNLVSLIARKVFLIDIKKIDKQIKIKWYQFIK